MPRAGTRLYLAIDAGPIYDDAGQLVAVVETLRDITAQKVAQDELQRLATRDGLTGVANRRSFDTALNTECRRVSREARALSLLMIDVDHFKRYNDTYGHLAGDECLRQVAEAMAQVTQRASDTLARYGGEEFAILLPATEPQGAVIVAERLRAAVEGLALPHARSDVGPHVTVSIGVASIDPARAAPPTELIGAADAALYAAKMQGRNRVVQAAAGEAAPSS
jgi:diguanylate cyclase (GGDEF)-like protein